MKAESSGLLYKSNILDLYGELFYSGKEVRKLQEPFRLPAGERVVYLLGTEFPQRPDRIWTICFRPVTPTKNIGSDSGRGNCGRRKRRKRRRLPPPFSPASAP